MKEAGGEGNPDGLWPVQANGFSDLLKRAQAQAAAIEENRQRVGALIRDAALEGLYCMHPLGWWRRSAAVKEKRRRVRLILHGACEAAGPLVATSSAAPGLSSSAQNSSDDRPPPHPHAHTQLSELRDLAHKLARRQEAEIHGRIRALQVRCGHAPPAAAACGHAPAEPAACGHAPAAPAACVSAPPALQLPCRRCCIA